MFSGFNVKLKKDDFENFSKDFDYYKDIGQNQFNDKKDEIDKAIEEYDNNTIIKGTELQNDWFPLIEADIFISYSHIDKELAIAFAGYIFDTYKLTCFIDSCVWGYADKLLEKLNNIYSNKKENFAGVVYNHNRCNIVSQHVNTMLSIALHKMIDKTEAVMLLNTENSISKSGNINDIKTYSPWLYTEITCTDIIRKKPLITYRDYKNIIKKANLNESKFINFITIAISYDISLNHLVNMDINLIKSWEGRFKDANKNDRYEYPLDVLYKETHPRGLKSAISSYQNGSASIIKEYFKDRSNRKIENCDENDHDKVIEEHPESDDEISLDEIISDGFSRIMNETNKCKKCKNYYHKECWCYYNEECQCFQEIVKNFSYELK
ncbi:hypothetical protein KM799_15080 [Clostridium tyrobutyricum]|uniref:hypothetical protein n=1 Tax=Clostridium tyrobutyricum TaxID=1519 RepID=UPI001C382E62|nr:hypothetical protein [Clostridium tyrobutyricum]MBV4447916.1 hypothetical protein [Clostridium tyrobutyricum]